MGVIAANQEVYTVDQALLIAGLFDAMCPNPGLVINSNLSKSPSRFLHKSIFRTPVYQLGDLLRIAGAKIFELNGFPENSTICKSMRHDRESFHCLGDPAMKIRNVYPKYMDPIIETENGHTMLNDPRDLICVDKITGRVIIHHGPSHIPLEYILNDHEQTLVLSGYEYSPVILNPDIMPLDEQRSNIASITQVGDKLKILTNTNNNLCTVSRFDIYGNKLSEQSSVSGEFEIPSGIGLGIIVLSAKGKRIDSKRFQSK